MFRLSAILYFRKHQGSQEKAFRDCAGSVCLVFYSALGLLHFYPFLKKAVLTSHSSSPQHSVGHGVGDVDGIKQVPSSAQVDPGWVFKYQSWLLLQKVIQATFSFASH